MTVLDEEKKPFQLVVEQHDYTLRDPSRFNRLDYAMRALEILKPKGMKIVVYERIGQMRIERGPEPRRGPEASWASVGIPPHASREHIAVGLAELAGVSNMPYMLDVLLRA